MNLENVQMQTCRKFQQAEKLERRRKPRMYDPVPVRIRGKGEDSETYSFETVTRDLGAGGLCASAPRMMHKGEKLIIRIRFSVPGTKPVQAPVVSVRATVVRVNESSDGACIFAASFVQESEA